MDLSKGQFLIYRNEENKTDIEVILNEETLWLTQKQMGELFGVASNNITYHIQEIYKNNELQQDGTTQKIRVVQNEGSRKVARPIDFYNLDMVISVGYRVNSVRAVQFRIWATERLKEYLIKGFTMDDARLAGTKKNYFEELYERVRTITRLCAPMDYAPSTKAFDKTPRFHFWDYESDVKRHTLSLLPNQIVKMEFLTTPFEPSEFVTWATKWTVARDWGKFS